MDIKVKRHEGGKRLGNRRSEEKRQGRNGDKVLERVRRRDTNEYSGKGAEGVRRRGREETIRHGGV